MARSPTTEPPRPPGNPPAGWQLLGGLAWSVVRVPATEGCNGLTLREVKLTATGAQVAEQLTIKEGIGAVTYHRRDESGKPGIVERVLTYTIPLR